MNDLQKILVISGWATCLLITLALCSTAIFLWATGSDVPKTLNDMALLAFGVVLGAGRAMAEKTVEAKKDA